MLALRQATLNHVWEHQLFRMTVITLSVANVNKIFKQVNIHKAAGPDGLSGRVLKACADQLASVFTDLFNLSLTVCNTYMFQADHHSPCAQEHQGNMPKWPPTRSTHVCSHEVLWKAGHGSHQHPYSSNPRHTEHLPLQQDPGLPDGMPPVVRVGNTTATLTLNVGWGPQGCFYRLSNWVRQSDGLY